jgi:hypothetical protein
MDEYTLGNQFHAGISRNITGREQTSQNNVRETTIPFQPISFEENCLETRCSPGHIHVFRQLIKTDQLQRCFGIADMPFREYNQHVMNYMCPFMTIIDPNSTFDFPIQCVLDQYYKEIKSTWAANQRIRHSMKRLLSLWLQRKCSKKYIQIPNFQTLEEPNEGNSVKWTDVESRCIYVIDGEQLIKSIDMYLKGNSWGISEPIFPRNPMTNRAFHIGQLNHITYQLYGWSSKMRRKPSALLTNLQEMSFNLDKFLQINRPRLAHNACKELFNDMKNIEAIEQWMDVIKEYNEIKFPITLQNRLTRWLLSSGDKLMIDNWRILLPDVIQFKEFNYFVRESWQDEEHIRWEVRRLWNQTSQHLNQWELKLFGTNETISANSDSDEDLSESQEEQSQEEQQDDDEDLVTEDEARGQVVLTQELEEEGQVQEQGQGQAEGLGLGQGQGQGHEQLIADPLFNYLYTVNPDNYIYNIVIFPLVIAGSSNNSNQTNT